MSNITTGTIYSDLCGLEEKLGKDFIYVLAAKVIKEHCWWNWDSMKKGILNDEHSKFLFKGNEDE